MAEWFKAVALKAIDPRDRVRGFESYFHRHEYQPSEEKLENAYRTNIDGLPTGHDHPAIAERSRNLLRSPEPRV